MASKRAHSLELVPNPFIKKKNLEWMVELRQDVYADDRFNSGGSDKAEGVANLTASPQTGEHPSAAAVEAGEVSVEDHLAYFGAKLASATLVPFPKASPHLPVPAYRHLYSSNSGFGGGNSGAHFVVHQHDHPVAGTHYDLRLQINATSSASWAIMYGLPGNPNSRGRLNRNATETRVHCLWNHLVETASGATGSLLIWDTGTYSILEPPGGWAASGGGSGRRKQKAAAPDPDSQVSADGEADLVASATGRGEADRVFDGGSDGKVMTEQEKLQQAFQSRKIRVRLHGTKLPENYVLNLRLTTLEDVAGRARSHRKPARMRRAARHVPPTKDQTPSPSASSSSAAASFSEKEGYDVDGGDDETVVAPPPQPTNSDKQQAAELSAMEREIRELEDEEVRRNNAYPGASNTIGSVHQRKWYLSLDREASGFVKRRKDAKTVWEPVDGEVQKYSAAEAASVEDDPDPRLTFPFYVRGPDVERSVVTGRLAEDVLRDEGVVGFVKRKGWRPVLV
ncbi:DNA polymerase ligase-domain-containing protein [Xylariales sp. PMI_506]|nr:DNA polymerase ligase-domain-containing protein [Xylariales sp. PMI_506]